MSPADKAQIEAAQAQQCGYHGTLTHDNNKGLNPMEKFLAEGASEQYAVFIRPDTGELSISKRCTCLKMTEGQTGRCVVHSKL
jgi:hypothetical protein